MNFLEYFTHPAIFAFGMTLVHSLWQLMLIALAWRITIYLTRNSASYINYNISLFSLLAFPVVFLVTFLRQLSAYGSSVPVNSLLRKNVLYLTGESTEVLSVAELQNPGIARYIEFYSPLIVWLYLIFVLILSFKSLLGYARIKSFRTRNLSDLPDFWQSRVRELVSRTGLRKTVPVFLSPRISIPIVAGFIKPVILLPLAMLSSLDVRQVEAILLHELYHIRNYDHLVNTIQNFLEILFFFHPATWWISSHVRREREKKVDELVISTTGKPFLYATALLTLETKRQVSHQSAIAAVDSKNQLLIRIKNIMTMKNKATNPGLKTSAILAILISVIVIAALNTVSNFSFATPGLNNLTEINHSPELQPGIAYNIPFSSSIPELEEAKEIFREIQENREERHSDISDPEVPDELRLQSQQAREEMLKAMEQIDSEEFKEQMRTAREDMESAMQDFNSGKFMEEMRKSQEEMRQAMQDFNSDEFREQMRRAGEEMRITIQQINSEEFRDQMRKAQEELKIALEEFNSEEFREQMRKVQEQINSEEFREQMRKVQEELKQTMQEINTEEVKERMRRAMEEMKRVFEELKLDNPKE